MCCFRAWNALCLSGPFHWPDQNLETMDVRSSLLTHLWPHISQSDLKVLSNYSFQLREEGKNQYFSINTNWHSSPLYWLILQIFLGITVISFCYWSINYNPMWALLCHFLQFFSLFSMYCHLMAYPCVFQNNLFKGCVKKKKPRKQKHHWHFALILRADKSCKSGWCFFLFLMWIIQMSRR